MKKLSYLIITLATAAISGPSMAASQPLIIGGTTVAPGDAIAQTTVALVGKDSSGEFVCSGSILAADLIVTAGHCLGDNAALQIVFRQDAFKGTGPVTSAIAGLRPAGFNTNRAKDANDIALLYFQGGLPAGYHPATVLPANDPLQNGEVVTLAGYGIDVGNPPQGSDGGAGLLRETTVTIEQAQWGKTEVVVDQTQGKGACHGDSGGPAFKTEGDSLLLFGVTSRGEGFCDKTTVYTNIVDHLDWLHATAPLLRAGQGQLPQFHRS